MAPAGMGTDASPAFARLKEALQAAKDMTVTERNLRESVAGVDMRSKVYAVLHAIGVDELMADLTESEKVSIAVAENYEKFRLSEELLGVKADLAEKNVNAIAADSLLLEGKIEEGFDLAMATKSKQQRILLAVGQESRDSEANFFNGILLQREQELQAQRLMQKSSPSRGNAKKRKEAQAKKDDMVKNSLVK